MCQIKIILYEKPEKEFYFDLTDGKCPPALASYFRRLMTEKSVGIEEMHALSAITTAKGRQQANQMITRAIKMYELALQEENGWKPKKQLREEILAKRAGTLIEAISGLL